MIKVNLTTNECSREELPKFLKKLAPESLLDLSWTDPQLGVSPFGFWPEVDQSPALGEYERYGVETLTADVDNKQVIVTRAVEPWTQEEIDADILVKQTALAAECGTEVNKLIQSKVDEYNALHSLSFSNVHNCESYSRVVGYPHAAFCSAVWAWSVDVWVAARQAMDDAQAGTVTINSPEDLIALLPVFGGE